MEKEALITAMKSSISEVLETMFFLPLDFPGTDMWDSSDPEEETLICRLNFTGPFEGYFVIFIPKEQALSFTADFLGKDSEGISRDQVNDTVKETLNMIAGSTFRNYDDQAVFDLGFPEIIELDDISGDDSGEEVFITINTLDNYLALKMVQT